MRDADKKFSIRYGGGVFGGFWKRTARVDPSSVTFTVANSIAPLPVSADCLLNLRKKHPIDVMHSGPDQLQFALFNRN